MCVYVCAFVCVREKRGVGREMTLKLASVRGRRVDEVRGLGPDQKPMAGVQLPDSDLDGCDGCGGDEQRSDSNWLRDVRKRQACCG